MALQKQPGYTGFKYGMVSSLDKRAIGKFTDDNLLQSLMHDSAPTPYDKRVISLYSQSTLYSNDFLDMLNNTDPFYVDGTTDEFYWDVEVPYQFTKIIDVPASTLAQEQVGIDGKEFELVLDYKIAKNEIFSIGHLMEGPQVFATSDSKPHGRGYLASFILATSSPSTAFIDKRFLQAGIDVQKIGTNIGEFDQDLGGLDKLGDKIRLYESIGAGQGKEHTITSWADAKNLRYKDGKPLDIIYYTNARRGEKPVSLNQVKWEPFIEAQLRSELLSEKVKSMFWSHAAIFRTNGGRQELKKQSAGIIPRMKESGNYISYNRGEFSTNLIRTVFGDLFYRRVGIKDRHVKLYTNEAGFDVFQQAVKEDALNSGLTLVANVPAIQTGVSDLSSPSQSLTYNYAFNSFVSRETGRVDLIHLQELDLPQTNLEFGQNRKSTPIFVVFDVSNQNNGLRGNVREVRRAGEPNMTWGYIDGRRHHLGGMASQGMSSANKFPGYTLWMESRSDVFIEDMSKTFLIQETPTF